MAQYIFFPHQSTPFTSNRTLVGFNLPGIVLVISLVEEGEHELAPALARSWTSSGRALEVLGHIVDRGFCSGRPTGLPTNSEISRIEIEVSSKGIPLHPYLQVIMYRSPNPHKHHFLSLTPIELDVSEAPSSPPSGSHSGAMEASEAGTPLSKERERSEKNQGSLREAIKLLNLAHSTSLQLTFELDSKSTAPPQRPLASPLSSLGIQRLRAAPLFVLRLLHTRLPFGGPLLKDVSATINQIDLRLEQAAFLPTQLPLLASSLTSSRPRYINFHTILWLIVNDVILGQAFGSVLREQNELFGAELGKIGQRYVVELPLKILRWLDDWPGGFKLNTDLSKFISSAFLALIATWDQIVLRPLLPHLPLVLTIIGFSGLLGTTMALSLLSDLLSVLTVHLYIAYLVASVSFRWMKRLLGTLFNVFRGKRVNVLRNRLDASDYSVDQLLLGTVLFTLLAFLFPTVLAYYLFFATSRFAIIFLHAGLETCLAFLNHFPLFAVMLRFKDPARLPGGIELRPSFPGEPSHLTLKNQPIPLSRIFFQHFALVSRLSAHYSPIRLIRKLVAGETIRPIERFKIRYSSV